MGIPILDELFSGIRWFIDFFLNKAPKPIKILIFLIFVLVFFSFIPVFLQMAGIHCTSGLKPVKVSPFKITQNFRLMMLDKDNVFNQSEFTPEGVGRILDIPTASCVWDVCELDGTYYWMSEEECENENATEKHLYQMAGSIFGYQFSCATCNGTFNETFFVRGSIGTSKTLTYVCDGDAYRIEQDDMNWYQKTTCDPNDRCMPPVGYYFKSDSGKYTCYDLNICGDNITTETVEPAIDIELRDADAQLIYGDFGESDYRRLLTFKCDKELSPQLTIFGIPLFDYKIWVMLLLIYVFGAFLFKIHG